MRRMSSIVCAVFLMAVPSAATAACTGLETQGDIYECVSYEFEQSDAKLQAAYDRLRAELGPVARKRLRDSQRAWIVYRDGWCEMRSAGVAKGSMYGSVLAGCRRDLIDKQTALLVEQLLCEGGDTTQCVPRGE